VTQGLNADFDSTDFPLNLTLNKNGGLVGFAPSVEIRLNSTSSSYLDWSDLTFKTSGWTTKAQPLTEVGNGHYTTSLDVAGLTGASSGDVLAAEYTIDDGAEVVGVASDTITISSAPSRLKEIWQILGLDLNEPLSVTATDRNAGTVITQTISVVGGTVTVTRT
jgi:hypothetical protein